MPEAAVPWRRVSHYHRFRGIRELIGRYVNDAACTLQPRMTRPCIVALVSAFSAHILKPENMIVRKGRTQKKR